MDRQHSQAVTSDQGFLEAVEVVAKQLSDYRKQSRHDDVASNIQPLDELLESLDVARWIAEGGMDHNSLQQFLKTYLAASTRMHNPAYMAHQVAVPDFPSAVAELVHGAINNPLAIYEMGPSAAAVEFAVLNWMIAKIGWVPEPLQGQGKDHASGVFTHGGSLANLTAMLGARAAIAPDAWERGNPSDLVILVPPSSHYSIARAASIMGLGKCAMVELAIDHREVIAPDQIYAQVKQLNAEGKRVMALVANACATGSGLYDPLNEIADVCRERRIWLHVDGAHGASALLSPRLATLMKGVERADSLVWDAHKMLRVSGLSTAVLFRQAHQLQNAMQQQASYIFYGSKSAGVDLIHRTIECTKAPMASKLFFNLAWRGESGLAQYIESRYDATSDFYHQIRSRPNFSCPFKPESNILCFRYGDDDDLQIQIRESLMQEGKFHISSAIVAGVRYLRLAVMNPDTDQTTVNRLLDAIESGWPL